MLRTGARLAVGALIAALPLLATASSAGAASTTTGSCAWAVKLDAKGANLLAIDSNVTYWWLRLPGAPGETLTLNGQYPHSRYMALTSYDPRLKVFDSVYDAETAPAAGSINPFVAGNPRNSPKRSWAVTAHLGQRPAGAFSGNDLYAGNEFSIVYRVYLPDLHSGESGGEPLPAVTVNLPGGAHQQLPTCRQPQVDTSLQPLLAQGSQPGPPLGGPGTNPPTWHKFFNFGTSAAIATDNELTGSSLSSRLTPDTEKTGYGGYLEDAENAYLYTLVNNKHGVVVIHALAMTHPFTLDGEHVMGSGDVRYWSFCSYEPTTQRVYGCLADEIPPLDATGAYTVVVSTPADRPANATAACGVSWLPFGPTSTALLIFRNLLADPAFPYSVQKAGYGTEAADMGAYYPAASYADPARFTTSSCPTP